MIGEEFGFLGCLVILGLYIMLVALLIRIGLRLKYQFSRLLVIGIATKIFLFIFVNIAMVTGLIPGSRCTIAADILWRYSIDDCLYRHRTRDQCGYL